MCMTLKRQRYHRWSSLLFIIAIGGHTFLSHRALFISTQHTDCPYRDTSQKTKRQHSTFTPPIYRADVTAKNARSPYVLPAQLGNSRHPVATGLHPVYAGQACHTTSIHESCNQLHDMVFHQAVSWSHILLLLQPARISPLPVRHMAIY